MTRSEDRNRGKPRTVVGGPGGKGVTTTRITFASTGGEEENLRRREGEGGKGRGGW